MKINKIKKMIDKANVVSFDIFDTLIRRMVKRPCDVFDLVEKKYNLTNFDKVSNFKVNRIKAEKECRLSCNNEEIVFEDIYKHFSSSYTHEQLIRLRQIEENIEKDICRFNYQIKDIFEYCKKKKKIIIITSDMYLDEKAIKEILKKNNIKFYKLYLSSSIGKTKNSGSLFKFIIKDLGIRSKKLVHIGDNKKSDFLVPKRLGIKSILWKNNNRINRKSNGNITEDIIDSFLNNTEAYSGNVFSSIGFDYFGPLLLCFSKWLLSELEENKIEKAFFLSRDGYIMKRAFDIINKENIKSDYFYASRRAIIVPSLKEYADIHDIFSCMHLSEDIKIKSLLKKIGLDDLLDDQSALDNFNLEIEKEEKLSNILNRKQYIEIFQKLYPLIIDNSNKEYKSFINYKNTHNFTGNVAIVDIGWFGNIQHALERLKLDTNIYGYYMGIEPRKNYQSTQKMNGFIFETNRNYDYFLMEHNFNSIFEMLFLGRHGSVKRYNSNEEYGVEFYEYEYDGLKEKNNIINLQDSAIKFVKEFYESGLIEYLVDDLSVSFERLADIFLNPSLNIAKQFGDMVFLDDEKLYIAKPKRGIYYFNPKKLIHDYKRSIWKIGFLKRIFKFKLPYYKINMYIRKHYLNIKGRK